MQEIIWSAVLDNEYECSLVKVKDIIKLRILEIESKNVIRNTYFPKSLIPMETLAKFLQEEPIISLIKELCVNTVSLVATKDKDVEETKISIIDKEISQNSLNDIDIPKIILLPTKKLPLQ